MSILYIDASVREDSRTRDLAQYLLEKLTGEIKEIKLTNECIPPLTMESLEQRTNWVEELDFDEPIFYYAKEYINADTIVIAAPYWDLSFPATLKTYIEAINVVGLTFKYDPDGKPLGLCNAKRLIYITTGGGKIIDGYGFDYIRELAQKYHGIHEVDYIKAEGLDIDGADTNSIIEKARHDIDKLVDRIKD